MARFDPIGQQAVDAVVHDVAPYLRRLLRQQPPDELMWPRRP
jgi:hypothetical protein